MLLALAGGVHAEMTVSQSNDPAALLGLDLTTLLGQENNALGKLDAAQMQSLLAPPAAKPSKGMMKYSVSWLDSLPKPKGGEEFQCLASALYFESRGEGIKGQVAVAEVILNRVDSSRFPSTICGVVNQGNGNGCQFSFTCDGKPERVSEPAAWLTASKIARAMMDGAPRNLTDGAMYFHTPAVRPSWSRSLQKTAEIGQHIFYRLPIQTAMN